MKRPWILALALIGLGLAGCKPSPKAVAAKLQAAVAAGDNAALSALVDRQAVYDSLFDRLKAQMEKEAAQAPAEDLGYTAQLAAETIGPMSEGLSTTEAIRVMLSTGKSPMEAWIGSLPGNSQESGPGPQGPVTWLAPPVEGAPWVLTAPGQHSPLRFRLKAGSDGAYKLVDIGF